MRINRVSAIIEAGFILLCCVQTFGGTYEFDRKPNFVILLADDMGYNDLFSFGHPSQEFNELDRMALEGMSWRNLYAGDSLCTPSRAALLTGRLPARYGFVSESSRTLHPTSTAGLPHSELTIARALQAENYTTGYIGKWHLGINRDNNSDGYYLPHNYGFDYVGLTLPNSNEVTCAEDNDYVSASGGPDAMYCFLYNGSQIIQQPVEFKNLTADMTYQALDFIHRNKDIPFYLQLSFPQPHVALYSSLEFTGTSRRGLYGDAVNEVASSSGRIMDLLTSLGLAQDTLVVFTSDNGGWVEMCVSGGNNGAFDGTKGMFWEGGIRVPGIFWMPGRISAGSHTHEIGSHLDLFPTLLDMAGASLPDNITIDGYSLVNVLLDNGKSERDVLFIYCQQYLFTVRTGSIKLVYRSHTMEDISRQALTELCPLSNYASMVTTALCTGEDVEIFDPPLIFNIDKDIQELYPLSAIDYPGLMDTVNAALSQFNETFFVADIDYGETDNCVVPCCDPPVCSCNYPGEYVSFTLADTC